MKPGRSIVPLEEYPCGHCGEVILLKPGLAHCRMKRSKTGKIYCSRWCQGQEFTLNYAQPDPMTDWSYMTTMREVKERRKKEGQ